MIDAIIVIAVIVLFLGFLAYLFAFDEILVAIVIGVLWIGKLGLIALIVLLLWNAILPNIWQSVSEINFWQALGLVVLVRLLVGLRRAF